MSLLENASVQKVIQALHDSGSTLGAGRVRELDRSARTAQDAANTLECDLGAIVKSLVFVVGTTPVMALIAGDRKCDAAELPKALRLDGQARRANAAEVRSATGFAIGGVPPVGLAHPVPTVIDVGLKRFDLLWAAAGHPYCVFSTSVDELKRLTGGTVSYSIGVDG